ncbi:MAG: universal stress protein [Pseudomonadales bacterium]
MAAKKQNRTVKRSRAGDPPGDNSKMHPENLLLVYDDALSSSYLFEKARLLSGPATRVHVVQVIYEGIADLSVSAIENSAQLKTFLLESAESELEEQLFRVRSRLPDLESATLWNSRHWEGVLHAAAETDADLILKAADEKQAAGIGALVRTPSEWNLLRHSKVPVMIVKPQAWPKTPTLLCALDVFDETHQALNLDLLAQSRHLADALSADLCLVCAYPLFEPWVGELGAVKSYEEIKDAVEQDIRDRIAKLVKKAGIRYRHLILDEGQAAGVLARVCEEADAALLILGTHAREGVGGVLLGNTSERILHAVDTDVLTVPLRSRNRSAKTARRAGKSSKTE